MDASGAEHRFSSERTFLPAKDMFNYGHPQYGREIMFLLARTEFVLNDVKVSVSSTLLSKNKDKKGDMYNV